MILLLWLCALKNLSTAIPNINLPINAQVPPVAKVNQPFRFTFSDSTFTSLATVITYSLSDSPPWLVLDGPSRTLSGTPGSDAIGSLVVSLNAADNSGSVTMPVTLVVSAEAGPTLGLPLSDQLPAYGALSTPNSILMTPSSPLSISFSPATFAGTKDAVYYAISDNNTPLPSWIRFDSSNLSFAGTTPQVDFPADAPQSYGIRLTASNVIGFSDADVAFNIVIEKHLLYFNKNVQIVNVTAGSPIHHITLLDALVANGKQASPSDVVQAWPSSTPSWLSLDSHTLELSGTPPADFRGQNFTVTISNVFGDSATTIVILQSVRSSNMLLLDPLGVTNATVGSDFAYALGQIIHAPDVELEVALGIASSWLEFDGAAQLIKGHVPKDLMPQQVVVNITARQNLQSESEILTIAVQNWTEASNGSPAAVGNTNPTSSPPKQSSHVQRGWIAAAVLVPLALLLGLGSLSSYCWRKRRRRRHHQAYRNGAPSLSGEKISRPLIIEKIHHRRSGIGNEREVVSKRSSRVSLPPRLDFRWSLGESRRNRYSNISAQDHGQGQQIWQTARDHPWGRGRIRDGTTAGFASIAEERASGKANPQISRTMEAANQVAAGRDMKRKPSGIARQTGRKGRSSLIANRALKQTQIRSGYGHGKPDAQLFHDSIFSVSRQQGTRAFPRSPAVVGFGPVQRSWRNIRESYSRGSWVTEPNSSDAGRRIEDRIDLKSTIRPITTSWSDHGEGSTATPTISSTLSLPVPKRDRNPQHDTDSVALDALDARDQPVSSLAHSPSSSIARPSTSYGKNPSEPPRKRYQRNIPTRVLSVRDGFPETADARSQSNPFLKGESGYMEQAKLLRRQAQQQSSSIGAPSKLSLRGSRDPRFESAAPSETASVYDDDFLDTLSNTAGHSFLPPARDPLRGNPVDADAVRAGLSASEAAASSRGPLRELVHRLSRTRFLPGSMGVDEDGEEWDSQLANSKTTNDGDSEMLRDDATAGSHGEPSVRAGTTRGQRLGSMLGEFRRDRSLRGEMKDSASESFV